MLYPQVKYFILLLLASFCISAPMKSHAQTKSIDEALAIFSNHQPEGIEGIWHFVDDKVTVMIQKSMTDHLPSYTITVLDSFDGSLLPGTSLGQLEATPRPDEYSMTLATSHSKKGSLTGKRRCRANICADGFGMIITQVKSKYKISFSPTTILPGLWRMVRLSEREDRNTPASGFIKLYPSYDGNGSSKYTPRVI